MSFARLVVFLLIAGLVLSVNAYAALAQCTHDPSHWHAPACGHEHGDAPPQWIGDAGYTVAFDHAGGFHGNTSESENVLKHPAMKGYTVDVRDYSGGAQQVYFRVHMASNVLDRMARYHSYEVFMRDAKGGVSHWQGWFNSGDPVTDRFVYDGRNDPGRRPIVLVQTSRPSRPSRTSTGTPAARPVGTGISPGPSTPPPSTTPASRPPRTTRAPGDPRGGWARSGASSRPGTAWTARWLRGARWVSLVT
jgi:hypothetical protein